MTSKDIAFHVEIVDGGYILTVTKLWDGQTAANHREVIASARKLKQRISEIVGRDTPIPEVLP